MADIKRIVTMGGTVACIAAIGFFMQHGANTPQQETIGAMGMAPGANQVPNGLEIKDIALTSADETDGAPQASVTPQNAQVPVSEDPVSEVIAAAEPDQFTPESESRDAMMMPDITESESAADVIVPATEEPEHSTMSEAETADPMIEVSMLDKPAPTTDERALDAPKNAAQCDVTMTGTPMAAALVNLDLNAPCLPNERVTIHQNGMMFTDTTDAEGKLEVTVPALSEMAIFIASFSNTDGAVVSVHVDGTDAFSRAVVQSEIGSGVELHALEFGADYPDDGHVWSDAPGSVANAIAGKGGFVTLLGNPELQNGRMAQVYSYPTGLSTAAGDIDLSVEIAVTDGNCGQEIEAETLQDKATGGVKTQALDLTMPDCDAVGDYLVLKNMLDDLKVAAK
jgi:hypothetical protein